METKADKTKAMLKQIQAEVTKKLEQAKELKKTNPAKATQMEAMAYLWGIRKMAPLMQTQEDRKWLLETLNTLRIKLMGNN